jgi:formylglycine-generating enzyme required for sulfatase activity
MTCKSPSVSAFALACTLTSLFASAAAQQWTQLNPATSPSPRSTVLSWDRSRGVGVLFGGYAGPGSAALSDTWEWSSGNWVQRAPATVPFARWSNGLAFDRARQRIVMFGGYSPLAPGVGAMNDTWEYDGTNWTQRTPTNSPPRRLSMSMTYDVARGRIVMFGGYEYPTTFFSDTWEWDGVNWTQRVTASSPSPRRGMMMAYDESRNTTVAFGGGDGTQLFGDTWTYDGANWTQRFPTSAPSARWSSSFAYDGSCGAVTLFGGTNTLFALLYNDVWQWDGVNWAQVPSAGMSNRHGLAMDYDNASRRLVGFGGASPSAQIGNETWQRKGGCDRTMSEIAPALLNRNAVYQYAYPASVAPRIGFHFLTLHFPASFSLQVPGFSVVGEVRMDLANILLQDLALLGPTGTATITVAIPDNASLLGYEFDVQSADIDFVTNRIYLAANDIEVTVGPLAPPSSFNMLSIPAGSYSMGSAAIGGVSAPAHAVNITRAFWMTKYEVTQAEYQARMGFNPSIFQGGVYTNSASRPVDNVTYAQAVAYCAAVQAAESAAGRVPPGYVYRLPTEAEWEYACRAGTSTEWNFGASITCPQANHATSVFARCVDQTRTVGSYAANALGLFDMHGNVAEWVLDRWDGTANYPQGPVNDPYINAGPLNLLRGGSWNQIGDTCRSAARSTVLPGLTTSSNGFRMVLGPILP